MYYFSVSESEKQFPPLQKILDEDPMKSLPKLGHNWDQRNLTVSEQAQDMMTPNQANLWKNY
jgi:hypothetical protein